MADTRSIDARIDSIADICEQPKDRELVARLIGELLDDRNALIKRYRDALEEILSIEPVSPEGGHEAVAEIHGTARVALGVPACPKCGQTDKGQTGEYACQECGLPTVWDGEPTAGVGGPDGR